MHFWRLCRRLLLLACVLRFGISAQTGLVVSPTDIALAVQAGSTTPALANVAITTPVAGLPFSVAVRHLGSTPNWLSPSTLGGTTPASLGLSANGAQLAPGVYQARVEIQAGGIGRVVNVALTVGTRSGAGTFAVSPTSLTFVASIAGAVLDPQTISVTSHLGSVGFRVVPTSSGWLLTNPLTGTTPGGISVDAYSAGLSPGRYSGAVAIHPLDGGAPAVVPVTLIVAGSTQEDRLRLSQSAINVNYLRGSTIAPAEQRVVVTTAITSRFYTATSDREWIRLSTPESPTPSQSTAGFTNGLILIEFDTQDRAAVNFGSVTVTAEGLPPVTLDVTLRVSNEPALNAQPSTVVIDEVQDDSEQSAQEASRTLVISSTGADMSFTATATTATGGGWLTVTPQQSSTTPQAIVISANPSGLPSGTYTGTVLLTAQNGSTFSIPVRYVLTRVDVPGTLFTVPDAITLSATVGDINPVQTLALGVNGVPSHPFTASTTSQGGWLTVDPFSGNAPTRLGVTANLANLPGAGDYNGLVIITSLLTGAQLSVPVTLRLVDQILSVNPESLVFVQPRRGQEAPQQTLQINSPIPARFDVIEKPNWVRFSQNFGNAPAQVRVWAELSLLAPGTNTGTIRIAGPKNTVTLPVSFQAAAPAAVTVSPASVALQYAVGQPTLPTQVIEVASGGEPGPFQVAVTTASGGQWLRADPLAGTTPGQVRLTIDPLLLAPGRYTGSVAITVNNGAVQTVSVPVELQVGSPSASVQAVNHGAILTPTPVAPGQVITILGSGLGPLLGITSRPNAAGAYETRVAETRVLFDNTPAPILFLRNDQINAIVPYSVFGRVSTTMRIEQGTNWSLPLELRVVDAVPGIFTANGTGRGQAAAMNADLTTNSASNPAARGSVISLYMTGDGQTDPPGNDGRVILTDLRRPVLPVTARIGGRPAEVVYAGSAPMLVSGVTQVNLRIPEDVQPGVLTLELQVGSANSQSAVTIAVR